MSVVKLSVLTPISITDAILTSSTVPENDYAVWDSVTTFALGDRVISTVMHRIYESGKTGNTNKDPTDINNRIGAPPWWIDIGPTNRYAMFDAETSVSTTIGTPLTVVLRPGFFNALSMFGIIGETVDITIKDSPGGAVVYSYSGSMENSAPGDYYEYFFSPFQQQPDLVLKDLPPYYDAEITLTLSSVSGSVSCSRFAHGDLRTLGDLEFNAEAQPKTYSYIKTDDFGVTTIKRRKSSKDLFLTADVPLEIANQTLEIVTDLLDVPAVWIASDLPEHAGLRVFGLGSGKLKYDLPKNCLLTINVKGLI